MWRPESTAWNPGSKTFLDYLILPYITINITYYYLILPINITYYIIYYLILPINITYYNIIILPYITIISLLDIACIYICK